MSTGAASESVSRPPRPAAKWWRRPLAELAGLVVGLVLFSRLHNLAGTDVAAATLNAQALQSAERVLHLDVEVPANQWLSEHPTLMQVSVLFYRLYYLPLACVLLWVLFFRAKVYLTLRRILTVMAPLALLIFWLAPMSPPRFALAGIVDIVAEHDLLAGEASRDMANGMNHFSAMPSMHVAWSALCADVAWLALRGKHPQLALLAWLFPIGTVAVVIATGNHYVLDVVGSAVLLGISIAGAAAWARYRRTRLVVSRERKPRSVELSSLPPVHGPAETTRRPSRYYVTRSSGDR